MATTLSVEWVVDPFGDGNGKDNGNLLVTTKYNVSVAVAAPQCERALSVHSVLRQWH